MSDDRWGGGEGIYERYAVYHRNYDIYFTNMGGTKVSSGLGWRVLMDLFWDYY
jgi:hypothetical protein